MDASFELVCLLVNIRDHERAEQVMEQVLDGRISTVFTGSADQREELSEILRASQNPGVINFGMRASSASIMSCCVRNRND